MSESLLRRFTLDEKVSSEVLRYIENAFEKRNILSSDEMTDEAFVEIYRQITEYADIFGTQYALNELLGSKSIELSAPALIEFYIHNSFAGNIPVVYTESTDDFEKLICELVYKSIFSPHIRNMGASFMHGKSKAFVILSNKPYSNVPASELGLNDEAWKKYSVVIRREHECLHYFTKKYYGITRNHLHDELIADFMGIVSAVGSYNAEWFIKFLGINNGTNKKPEEGRFGIYTKGLSPEALDVIKSITVSAAYSLEKYYKSRQDIDLLAIVDFLCRHDLLELTTI